MSRQCCSTPKAVDLTRPVSLANLADLTLESCTVSDHISDLPNLQTLAIKGGVLVVDSDRRAAPAAARPIAPRPEQSRQERVIRVEEHSFSFVYPSGFVRSFSPHRAFESASRIELDAPSYFAAMEAYDTTAILSLNALVVLKCALDHVSTAIHPDNPLPPRLAVWIESDFRLHRAHKYHQDVFVDPPAWLEEIQPICVTLFQLAAGLESLTLPLNLGIHLDVDDIEACREPLYALLKHYQASDIPVRFHNQPTTRGHSFDSAFTTLAECDAGGCFSDLVAGTVDDPELKKFRVVVV